MRCMRFKPAPRKGFRIGEQWRPTEGTVGDVIRFEAFELGQLQLLEGLKHDDWEVLDQYPASQAMWIARTFQAAKKHIPPAVVGELGYDRPNDIPDEDALPYIEAVDIPRGSVIVADDGDEGVLVLTRVLDKCTSK